ncbi:glutamic acid-rich protein [Drosophila grimshawi]|uniref:non-specific serine/threonine protein kinase n=1 Tax=Drosophila grimshawi TaxID=7222 RepID=B4J4N5_DROGR|nr:glutamic acid-rich protein [Drosophila grimshawi]XP_043070687.1 glutamic acid-rich protein [Drosophila grimshawi]XP_043070688.1 glutamic acid-rich protein [Drosophila grimshawi]EDW02740.1 GH22153 [Drosophila grimshawi]
MGKRIASERQHVTTHQTNSKAPSSDRSARKRKRAANKGSRVEKRQRMSDVANDNSCEWHENDDEDSSSSGSDNMALLQTPQPPARAQCPVNSRASLLSLATFASGGYSDHNNSNTTESPRPVYTLRPSVVNGTILRDVLSKAWRLGRPIGKGNFGEIFLASDDTVCPVSLESAKYVVKIEPHSNGPLFVEIHCLINTNQTPEITSGNEPRSQKIEKLLPRINNGPPSGIPSYIASGTHYFGDGRYRFLVLPRFDRDLHSLIKNTRVAQKSLLLLAIHIINVLEHLHDKGYCHNDIKAQNLMMSKCKYLKRQAMQGGGSSNRSFASEHYDEKQQTTDSGNSSEQEANDEDYFVKSEKLALKRLVGVKEDNDAEDEDEDFDDGATTNSNNSNSLDMYQTPVNKRKGRARTNAIEFSGSNPMRSCRRNDTRNSSSMYEEMVKSHYLRPAKRVSYSELLVNEDGYPVKPDADNEQSPVSSDNESEEFLPPSARRGGGSVASKRSSRSAACKSKTTRAMRRQDQKEELKAELNDPGRNGGVRNKRTAMQYQLMPVEEEHIFLIDFGLASKYQDRGVHRPFIMDQRRAHDGTLEFTSRDAHLGAHSRRSDLECLGYNLLYWSEGYLPWKDVAHQQQQEKVHRAKELFMTDVCEMLRQFYGKQVPKYLGEFLKEIGQLAYQERPNYERYRNIFQREYRRLGYDCSQMQLSSDEILRTRVSVKDVVDGSAKCDIFELNNKIACNVMRNATLSTPFQEHALTNRVSPKNLRSKSNRKNVKKKIFSWAEVLSQDPDQIARERAVKEFEREEVICPLQSRLPRRYEGYPTYAILAVEQSRRDKGLIVQEHKTEEAMDEGNTHKASESDEEYEDDEQEQEEEEEEQEEEEEVEEEQEEEGEEREADAASDEESDESECTTQSEAVRRGRGRPRNCSKQRQLQQQQTLAKSTEMRKKTLRPSGKSRNSNGHSQQIATPLTAVGGNKRGCATRKENATMASATGEVEQHSKLKSRQPVVDQPKQRRTRRCLYKTESHIRGEKQQDVENNYATNMQNVYSVWQYDDENRYGKGRNVNSSRHCRK